MSAVPQTGCPELAGHTRHAGNLSRVRLRDTLVPLLRGRIAGWNGAQLQAELEAVGIAAGPIIGSEDALEDAPFKARHLRKSVPYAAVGDLDVIANPIVFSAPPNFFDREPPELGADTDAILNGEHGMSGDAIAALREAGILR